MEIITRIGGVETTSMITVAEADVLLEELPDDTTEWNNLTESEKKLRLILAADAMATLPFRGRRVYRGQAMPFPRTVQSTLHMIPDEAKLAQAFIAFAVIHRGIVNRPDSVTEDDPGTRVTQVSLGGLLSVSFSGSGVETGSTLDKIVRSSQFPALLLLRKWLTNIRGGSVRVLADVTYSTATTTTSTTSTTTTTTTTTVP